MTISVFESKSGQKYENKYNIGDIRPYPIRFHPYTGPHAGPDAIEYGGHGIWLPVHMRTGDGLDPPYLVQRTVYREIKRNETR